MVAEWRLARSRLRGLALAVIVCAVLLALLYTGPRELWHWGLLAALMALFIYDTARRWRCAVHGFSVQHGQWWLVIDGERVAAQLLDYHFAGHSLGVIRFRTAAGACHAVTILPDSMSGEDCRKLALALA
jgi:hypothetical protein